jgi:hypothetical protein
LLVGAAIVVGPPVAVATGLLTWSIAVVTQIATVAVVWVAAQLLAGHRRSSSAH